jgi:hypothetical protein
MIWGSRTPNWSIRFRIVSTPCTTAFVRIAWISAGFIRAITVAPSDFTSPRLTSREGNSSLRTVSAREAKSPGGKRREKPSSPTFWKARTGSALSRQAARASSA